MLMLLRGTINDHEWIVQLNAYLSRNPLREQQLKGEVDHFFW